MYDARSTTEWAKSMSKLGHEVNDLVKQKCKKPGNRILICDEDSVTRDMISSVLKTADYRIVTGESGQCLIDILKANDIGLLITDLDLPDMEGSEIIDIMAKHHVPMIALTSLDRNSNTVAEAKMKGFTVLDKPLDPKELLNTVVVHFGTATGQKSESKHLSYPN